MHRTVSLGLVAAVALGLSACGSSASHDGHTTTSSTVVAPASTSVPATASAATSAATSVGSTGMDHSGHSMDGGPAPAGIEKAASPKYPIGTKVVLSADHMPGMKGAVATVVGAFTTNTYAVDYTPTTGGAEVKDHKWVVQQELQDAGTDRLVDGAKVVITADHMPGMKGAHGTVASSTDETVYMVDVPMNGMTMTNHKWVVESEMSPAS